MAFRFLRSFYAAWYTTEAIKNCALCFSFRSFSGEPTNSPRFLALSENRRKAMFTRFVASTLLQSACRLQGVNTIRAFAHSFISADECVLKKGESYHVTDTGPIHRIL